MRKKTRGGFRREILEDGRGDEGRYIPAIHERDVRE